MPLQAFRHFDPDAYNSCGMALELYWVSGSPYSWRVMLALEHKRLPYVGHLLELSRQEHKSPHMLKLNPRGLLPVLKDGEYVIFESLAILYYLDEKYPDRPLFGHDPEEAGTIMRVICEYQANAEPLIRDVAQSVFQGSLPRRTDEITAKVHSLGNEARVLEARLSQCDWIVGNEVSAVDFVVFPGIQLLLRGLQREEAADLRSRFLPLAANYPALARWFARVEALPGYARTYPPHWRAPAAK
jgi:glutathione S-transferase